MSLISSIIYGFWFLSEVILNRLLRSKKTDQQNKDKGSLALIWIVIFINMFSAIFVVYWHHAAIANNISIVYAGLAIIIIGVVLRVVIVRSLGQFFTVDVTFKQDHKLKKDGFYTHLGHPSYTASLLSFAGFGISLNNWISLALLTILVSFAFIRRINIEEKLLMTHFEDAYLSYKNNTKRLVPFIY